MTNRGLNIMTLQEEQYQKGLFRPNSSLNKVLIPFNHLMSLIKVKQSLLLVYTSVFSFLISSYYDMSYYFQNLILLIIAIFFSVSGATMFNMYIDRDIDAIMERTKNRPLPLKKVDKNLVMIYGVIFCIIGIFFASFINLLTTILVILGITTNVVIYSLLLKRKTRFSIIFGGIAGGLPAMIGRVAVINSIDILTLLLGLFVLSWIPVHILTLAALPKNLMGYRMANVPMWPVISSIEQNNRVVALSAIISSVVILIIALEFHLSLLHLIPLILFSFLLIFLSCINLINPSSRRTFKIFKLASLYMIIAFLALFIGLITS